MGFSDPENKPWAAEQIKKINPKTVLDVGAGQGVYLDLIRRDLGSKVNVTAVEVWKPYIDQFNLHSRYDKVINEDILLVDDFNYDLVIFGDVLEHMSESDALSVWDKVKEQAGYALISIPIIHYHQDAINNNPYEIHVEEDWSVERVLDKFSNIIEYKKFAVTGTFIAKFGNDNV